LFVNRPHIPGKLWRSIPHPSAWRSATIQVGRFVFVAGILDVIETSAKRKLTTPRTTALESSTAFRSLLGPIRQVLIAW
jgi:hypothetical protein